MESPEPPSLGVSERVSIVNALMAQDRSEIRERVGNMPQHTTSIMPKTPVPKQRQQPSWLVEIEDLSIQGYLPTALNASEKSEDTMFRGSKEYSLAELLEHPVLGVQIRSEGIERRCLDLMLDPAAGNHRFVEAEHQEPLPD